MEGFKSNSRVADNNPLPDAAQAALQQ